MRVTELKKWIDSGAYEKVLAGDYPKRGAARTDDFAENVKATAASYKESFDSAKDPLISALKDLGTGAIAAGSELYDLLKRSASSPKDNDPPDKNRG
jgi:hypothetical protein